MIQEIKVWTRSIQQHNIHLYGVIFLPDVYNELIFNYNLN